MTEQIYTAEELGRNAQITGIYFNKSSSESCTRNITIYMVHTSKDSFESTSDGVVVAEKDKVFSGTVTFNTNAWTKIVFDRAFAYNGNDNVLLAVDDNTGSYTNTTSFLTVSDEKNTGLYYRSDSYNKTPTAAFTYTDMTACKNAAFFAFAESIYSITTSNSIWHGRITVNRTEGFSGAEVTVTASPDTGYYCSGVSVNGGAVAVTENPDGTYSFTLPASDAVVSAEFSKIFSVNAVWKNWDGTVLRSQQVSYGQIPQYSGDTPVKPNDELFQYAFTGWDHEASVIKQNEDVEFTAMYRTSPLSSVYLTVCDSTDISRLGPYCTLNNSQHPNVTQCVYPISQLRSMAGHDIYSMTFYVDNSQSSSADCLVKGMQVFLVESDRTIITDIIDVDNSINAVKVFDGDYTFRSGECRIDFDVPFHYHGNSANNINDDLFVIIRNTEGGTNGGKYFYAEWMDDDAVFFHSSGGLYSLIKEVKLPKCTFGYLDETPYTITWADADGTVLEIDENMYRGNMPVFDGELPDPPAGYHIAGWSPSVGTVTGNATYKVKYEMDPHKVTFDTGNGTVVQEVKDTGKAKTFVPDCYGNNVLFKGWYLGDVLYDFNTRVIGDITLTAHWYTADEAKELKVGAVFRMPLIPLN